MTTADAFLPPQNLEAEESVLGAMMVSESAVVSVIVDVHLTGDDFYRQRHRLIFSAIHSLHSRGEPVDALTVTEQLTQMGELTEAGGKEMVSSLASTVPVAGNADHYARIVKANAMLRRLLEASHRIEKSVHERTGEPRDLVEQAERMMFEVAHDTASQDFASLTEILERETTRLEELSEGKRDLTGTASGFSDLDKLTGGFQPGNLVIVAARPAMGKSAWVGNIADFVAVEKKQPVAFFSLEMSETELAHRFLSCRAGIPGDKLRKGEVKTLWNKVLKASNQLEGAPIWIDTSSDLSTLELRAKARRLHSKEMDVGGLGLIIVDYIQLMRPDDPRQSRVEQVGAVSRGLKLLAGELNVPVLGLSQLSRAPEQRPDKRPILSDLRESGCLTGETPVYLPDEGRYERIDALIGRSGFRALALNTETWQLEAQVVTNAFSTGVKPVHILKTESGREIRATGNHKFLAFDGWKRLDQLRAGERVAVPWRGGAREFAGQTARISEGCVPMRDRTLRTFSSTPVETASDVYWDEIRSIEPDGVEEVYDLTVEEHHNFVAGEIVVHNSIEQDADLVCFLFREEYYEQDPEEDIRGKAEVILAKHRNGPIGNVELAFQAPYPRFRNMASQRYRDGGGGPPSPPPGAGFDAPPDDFVEDADDF